MNLSLFKEWPAFEEYDVIYAGEKEKPTHIAPVEGTNMRRINLVKQWLESRKRNQKKRPYMSIFEVNLEEPWDIAKWCSEFGLPGNLLHKLIDVKLWPNWHIGVGQEIFLSQPGYNIYKGSDSTRGDPLYPIERQPEFNKDEINDGELLSIKNAETCFKSERSIEKPYLLHFDFESNEIVRESITPEYVKYFPYQENIPELMADKLNNENIKDINASKYPLPTSDNFWREYGEPIEEIRQFIKKTRKIIQTYEKKGESMEDIEVTSSRDYKIKQIRQTRENYYRYGLSRVFPSGMFPSTSQNVIWEGPSLISAFLVQIMEDFEGSEGKLKECKDPKCDNFFMTDNSRKVYCSNRCKNRHTTAKSRAKNKE